MKNSIILLLCIFEPSVNESPKLLCGQHGQGTSITIHVCLVYAILRTKCMWKLSKCERGSSACLFQWSQHHNKSYGREAKRTIPYGPQEIIATIVTAVPSSFQTG